MVICHNKKCIFIHIPKTAGTSIQQFINDNKTLEERMNDYLSNSDKLAELAKKSSSSNVNKATIN